jgi:hypothetical protein
VNVAIGIVAHNDRFDMAYQLGRQVDTHVTSFDSGDLGAFGNHLQVWTALSETCTGADWFVVLEDDAQPVDGFHTQLALALDTAPTPVVSLYLGRSRPADIQQPLRELIHAGIDSNWILCQRMLHAVGIAVRADLVPDMISTLMKPPCVFAPIDQAIGMWARRRENIRYVSHCWPSLVDHADTGSVIAEHEDGQPRGPLIPTASGIPILERRVAWKVGTRQRWDSSVTLLGA